MPTKFEPNLYVTKTENVIFTQPYVLQFCLMLFFFLFFAVNDV